MEFCGINHPAFLFKLLGSIRFFNWFISFWGKGKKLCSLKCHFFIKNTIKTAVLWNIFRPSNKCFLELLLKKYWLLLLSMLEKVVQLHIFVEIVKKFFCRSFFISLFKKSIIIIVINVFTVPITIMCILAKYIFDFFKKQNPYWTQIDQGRCPLLHLK